MQEILKLQNGITVATDIMNGIETVAISVLIKTGSRNETKATNGMSHFIEHMAFKGTKTRTALQIAKEFDMIGGYFNAYTSREKTVFYAKVLKDDLETAVNILADITQNSIFEESEIEKERDVIIQEIAQTEDTPDDLIFDYFQETAYKDQAFGRSILGTVDNIKSFSKNDLLKFTNQNYSYQNIIVSAAGNFERSKFVKFIESKFLTFSDNTIMPIEKAHYTGGDIRISKDLEQVHIVMGFKGVSYLDEDFFKQQIFTIIAGGGMSSRLFQEIREKRGLAYSISSFSSAYNDSGIVGVYSGTTEDKLNELIDVTFNELFELTQNIFEEEIDRAKAQVKASILMSQESSVSRSEKLAGNVSSFGRYITVDEIIKKINLVNRQDLMDFGKNIFKKESLPTIASIGKIDKLYRYDDIVAKLKQ